jgi:septum formation inhibitor-activating ATPase MinD
MCWNASGSRPNAKGLIVNRHQRIGGSLSLADVAERLGREIDYVLPFDKRVIIAANAGEPIALAPGALRRIFARVAAVGHRDRILGIFADHG